MSLLPRGKVPEPEPLTRTLLGQGERAPIGHIGVQDWLMWPETGLVIQALQAGGARVRFVGGCVRDALAHRPVNDIDIATPDPPEVVLSLLEQAGLRAVPTGLAHGTVTAVVRMPESDRSRQYEITTLREDVATDGRHAEVQWTTSWMADAARRDFTINALSATPDGAVYDYFDGIEHLAHGRVVFVGRAASRIAEDYLRILRFFRFHARYGRGGVDPNGFAACQSHAAGLKTLSAERVRDELLKILAVPDPTPTLLAMRGARVLREILPEASAFGALRQVAFLEERGVRLDGVRPDPLRRLAGLTGCRSEEMTALGRRLKLSGDEIGRLTAMACDQPVPQDGALRAALAQWGRLTCLDRVLLDWARWRDVEGRADARHTARCLSALEGLAATDIPVFPIAGRDVLSAGEPAGPGVGVHLKALREMWLASDCTMERDDLLACLGHRLTRPPAV